MKRPPPSLVTPQRLVLRVSMPKSRRDPLYLEVAEPSKTLGESIGAALELGHIALADAEVTHKGRPVDLTRPVSDLPFAPLFVGSDPWAIVEITLKPLKPGPLDAGEGGMVGFLPPGKDSPPPFPSEAQVPDATLLAHVTEFLLLKAATMSFAVKGTVKTAVDHYFYKRNHLFVEPDRIERAIAAAAQQLGFATTPSRVIFPRSRGSTKDGA